MSPPAPSLCLTCSSTLSSNPLPSHSEKADPPPMLLPCGNHLVCGRCQRTQRRLAQNCILCESVGSLLGSSSPNSKDTKKRVSDKENRSQDILESGTVATGKIGQDPPSYEEAGDFVIGDDDSDDNDELAREPGAEPPAYEGAGIDSEHEKGMPEDEEGEKEDSAPSTSTRGQLQVHYIRPEETLLGIAMKYREPGEVLCRINKLPTSTLTTTPHLLHTLPFLLLPPTAQSISTEPIHSAVEERRRLVLRRFQVRTRCSDWAMANAYVSQVFRKRDEELEMVRANRVARGESVEGLQAREGGELEEAEEAWDRDVKWEAEQGGKGKGPMGSKLRSTGQVERQVGSWSWR
ncbi:hypothetical protein T439DRAFT_354487 [Meredithblackwellia eburnea MCA 4105]